MSRLKALVWSTVYVIWDTSSTCSVLASSSKKIQPALLHFSVITILFCNLIFFFMFPRLNNKQAGTVASHSCSRIWDWPDPCSSDWHKTSLAPFRPRIQPQNRLGNPCAFLNNHRFQANLQGSIQISLLTLHYKNNCCLMIVFHIFHTVWNLPRWAIWDTLDSCGYYEMLSLFFHNKKKNQESHKSLQLTYFIKRHKLFWAAAYFISSHKHITVN